MPDLEAGWVPASSSSAAGALHHQTAWLLTCLASAAASVALAAPLAPLSRRVCADLDFSCPSCCQAYRPNHAWLRGHVAFFLALLHLLRRLLESQLLLYFTRPPCSYRRLAFLLCFHLLQLFALLRVGAALGGAEPAARHAAAVLSGALVFLLGSGFNAAAHWQLHRQRFAERRRYVVPRGALFRRCRFPHFAGEALSWAGLALVVVRASEWPLLVAAVAFDMALFHFLGRRKMKQLALRKKTDDDDDSLPPVWPWITS